MWMSYLKENITANIVNVAKTTLCHQINLASLNDQILFISETVLLLFIPESMSVGKLQNILKFVKLTERMEIIFLFISVSKFVDRVLTDFV